MIGCRSTFARFALATLEMANLARANFEKAMLAALIAKHSDLEMKCSI